MTSQPQALAGVSVPSVLGGRRVNSKGSRSWAEAVSLLLLHRRCPHQQRPPPPAPGDSSRLCSLP